MSYTLMFQSLEDRLARRKALVESHNMKEEQQKHEIEYRRDAHDKSLQVDLYSYFDKILLF